MVCLCYIIITRYIRHYYYNSGIFLIHSVYTMQLMLDCKRFVERRLTPEERKSLNYTQLGWEALGPFGKWAVNISVLACILGVCAGYMIFNLEVCEIYECHMNFVMIVNTGHNHDKIQVTVINFTNLQIKDHDVNDAT